MGRTLGSEYRPTRRLARATSSRRHPRRDTSAHPANPARSDERDKRGCPNPHPEGRVRTAGESAEELENRQRVEGYLFRRAPEVSSLSWDEWRKACARREMEWCRQATICLETGVRANALRWERLVDDGILERAEGGARRVYYRISPAHMRYLVAEGTRPPSANPVFAANPQTPGGNPPIQEPTWVNESSAAEPAGGVREVPSASAPTRSHPELCLLARERVGASHGFKVVDLRIELSQSRDGGCLGVHRPSGRRFRVTQGADGAMVAAAEANADAGAAKRRFRLG